MTPLMSLFHTYLMEALAGAESAVPGPRVTLLWVSRSRVSLEQWFPEVLEMLRQAPSRVQARFSLRRFLSGSSAGNLELGGSTAVASVGLAPVCFGRPNVESVIDMTTLALLNEGVDSRSVWVSACGPPSLTAAVERAAGKHDLCFASEGFLF